MALRWTRLLREGKDWRRRGVKCCEDSILELRIRKTCPINRLPVEVLSLIFSYEDDPAWRAPGVPFALRLEVVISQVCRYWRSIALGMPFLWNRIAVVHFDEHVVAQTYALLKRSKRVPLEVRVDWRPLWDLRQADFNTTFAGPVDYRREALRDAMSALARHAHRWKLMLIRVDNQEVMQDVLTAFASCTSAPMLEHLCLAAPTSCEEDRLVPFDYDDVPFSFKMPKISYLSLRNAPSHWCGPSVTGALTVLKLHHPYHIPSITFPDFMAILGRSPGLETIWLSCIRTFDGHADWPGDAVELPALERLALHNIGPELSTKLLASIVAPNVTRLELNLPNCWGTYEALVGQLLTSYPGTERPILHSLEGLRIESLACAGDVLELMLHALPNLTVLCIDQCQSSIFYLVLLRYMARTIEEYKQPAPEGGRPPIALPELNTLVLGDSEPLIVRCVVEWRIFVNAPLRRVFVDAKMKLELEEEQRLSEQLDVFGKIMATPNKELLVDLDEVMDQLATMTDPEACNHLMVTSPEAIRACESSC